ncbi:MAG: TIGR03016 family PEP-CTERM system-associated outer membrane protein [Nitrosospira multiformis]|nr:TIGR03016 family PEP-CTERM system-associated outer membrane protein [Nitrosospira multiformis]
MKVPENKCRHGILLSPACTVAGVILVFSSYSSCSNAAEWKVLPRLNLIETYSDNLRLGSGGGDFITQINPGILLSGTARRFNLSVDYTMNNLIYARNSSFTRMRQRLNASGTAELMEDFFFVDGIANITQQNISLFGPQALNNVNVTGNRADVRTFNVSPYIRHRFKNFASTELRYAHNIVSSNASLLQNSQADSFFARLNSGTDFGKLHWGLSYSHNMIHFDRSDRTVELERSIGSLRYMFTPRIGLTATGGYERNSFLSIRGSPSSPTWSAGFVWTPSERTNIVANGGKRFFGDTYFAEATHRTRLTTWNFIYIQDITTFNQQSMLGGGAGIMGSLNQLIGVQFPNLSPETIQQNTGLLLGPNFSGSFLGPTNFFTNRLFLQKRMEASVAFNGARNTLVLRGFNMTRKAYSPEGVDADIIGAANAALLNHTEQTGGNAVWSYRVSQFTNANLSFAYTRFSFLSTDRKDDLRFISASLTRRFPQILPNLSGTIQYRRNERDSNQAGNYRENAAIAYVNMTF